MLVQHGRHNTVEIIFFINVVPQSQGNISQVISLCNVGPDRSSHQRSSVKNVLFEISQNSLKNTFSHLWATASTQIDPEKIVNYFSVKNCLRTVNQLYTGKFLVKFWLRHIKATLHMVFSCEKMTINRSSRSQMFFKICTFTNCAIFTGKHQCWSFSLMKLLG